MPETVPLRGMLFIQQHRIVGDHLVVVWIEGIDTQVEYHTAVSHEWIQDLRIPVLIGRIGRRLIERQDQTKKAFLVLISCAACNVFSSISRLNHWSWSSGPKSSYFDAEEMIFTFCVMT